MANSLKLQNFSNLNKMAQTSLTADIAANVSSLPVENSADFSAGGYVLLGGVGSSTAELLTATAPSDATTIPLSASTRLPHNFNEPVTLLFGNQISIYRANDRYHNGVQPPDSDFAKIATVNISPTGPLTTYTDASGTAGQWYKYTYLNSTSSGETLLSDSNAVQAGLAHYVSLDAIRRAAGFDTNPRVTDDVIAEKRDAAEREINGALTALYQFPLPQPTNPIIVNIARELAAGMLMEEEYTNVNPAMASQGENKADAARHGGGKITSLDELRTRSVVLEDANFNELTSETGNGVRGWPDETTEMHQAVQDGGAYQSPPAGHDYGFQATIDEVF